MSYEDTALTAAHAEVKAELARTDTKASLLLAFIGAMMAGAWTVATSVHLPVASVAFGAVGVAVLLAAAALLLLTVRPHLGGGRPAGFPKWATLTPAEMREALGEDDRPVHIVNLSRIAVRKFVRLRRAIDLTCTAGGLLVIAAVAAWGGGA
ncbi:Pycsar system effector family protein [Streptomyces chattanoogensis]|uniref:Integral membrane plasmid transfer protein n=1 Tax=Streptomyces chattanoogensis TaxID=66876 RepID=A0A0N0GXQ6_9ACTN|nr:Pycsar system effector family protein [Streptomyces chattanoogensis]KPC61259.1 integral membrane plasmid transfer protein [Streptomyces chattanoogensis]